MRYETYRNLFTITFLALPYMFLKYCILVLLLYVVYKLVFNLVERLWSKRIHPSDRGIFITGCDTGLGYLFAKHFDELGFTVFAGCLKEKGQGASSLKAQCSDRLHVVSVDVTDDGSVEKAFQYVVKNIPKKGLFSVINNAGMNMYGEVELTPLSIYEKGFNVNLYGAIRVIRTFLPLIRSSKGRIVNVTSVHGRMTRACQSNYETAKHGLETLSDSLRLEMKKFGVRVIVIEPGMFGSCTSVQSKEMTNRNVNEVEEMWRAAPDHIKKDYSKDYMLSWLPNPMAEWPPKQRAWPVVKVADHAVCNESPKIRYLVDGYGNALSFIDEFAMQARLHNLLPTWITDLWHETYHMKN